MTQFLPYVILIGVIAIFFVVCYIMFSKPDTSKKRRTRTSNGHQRVRDERDAAWATMKTLDIDHEDDGPRGNSGVTVHGTKIDEDDFGKELEQSSASGLKTDDFDVTRVLSREEVLAAMDRNNQEETQKIDESTMPLSDMAAIVASDLAKEQATPAAPAETVVMNPADKQMDQTRRMEPVQVDTAVQAKTVSVQPAFEESRPDTDVSPWGNELSSHGKKATDANLWGNYDDSGDPIIRQCVTHFLGLYGIVTPTVQRQVEQITIAAFRRIGCTNKEERERVVSSLVNQEALQAVQKAYTVHPEDYVASMALRTFFDVVHCSHTSTRHLIAVDTLKVLPYLSRGHFQVLAMLLLFLYSRNSNNVDAPAFQDYMEKYVMPFMERFPTERSYFQQLDYLRCTALETKETRFEEILSDSYPLLFRYRGFTDRELQAALHGSRLPSNCVVKSFNSQLDKLALVDEGLATRFFREAGVTDRGIQEHLLRLAKKRPAGFSGEEALDIMEEISPALADLGDLWDSTLLRVSTLSLLGLYIAQGYVKETIGEEFDLTRWFE